MTAAAPIAPAGDRVARAKAYVEALVLGGGIPAGLVLVEGRRPEFPAVVVRDPALFGPALLVDLDTNPRQGLRLAVQLRDALAKEPFRLHPEKPPEPKPAWLEKMEADRAERDAQAKAAAVKPARPAPPPKPIRSRRRR